MKNHFLTTACLLCLVFSALSFKKGPEVEYAWLAGRWVGEGFGGKTESIWSPPSEDGTMIGVFRLFNADGSIAVYQFLLLDRDGLRIKHFNANLKGWESKEEYVTFEMLSFSKSKVEMEGLIYERTSKDEIETRLEVNRDGKITTQILTKRRVK